MKTETGEYTIFPRQASGLTKAIGVWGATIFGIHCISLSSSGLIAFSWVASVWPGASIFGLLTVAMVASLIHSYTFAAIGAAMPRSGADYVLGSRILNPVLAFAASWTLVLFSGVVAGGLIAWIPKSALPALLQPMAIIFNRPTFTQWATYCSSSSGSLIIATVFVLLTLGLMLLPNHLILRILALGLILGLLAWGVIFFSLWDVPGPQAFKAAWNHFMAPTSRYGSFDQRLVLAKAAGLVFSPSTMTMTLAGLIMGFWIYYGYYIPTFFAGEVRKADTSATLLAAGWASILVTWIIFAVGALLLGRLVDTNWVAAEGYLANNADQVTKVAGKEVLSLPWITFYAAILHPNPFLIGFTALAWIYTLINLGQTYFFYSSRVVFSWAFDRIVPSFFTYVHPRTRSPIFSVIFIALLAEVGVIDAAYGGILGTQLTFAFFAVVTQFVAVTAITIFPFRAPEQFRLSPRFVRARILGFPVITLVGGVTLLYLLWMVVASFLYPAAGISNPSRTVPLLLGLLISGVVWFLGARYYRKRSEGLDIAQIYQRVPPA